MYTRFYYLIFIFIFAGCTHTVSIKNEKRGKLVATHRLVQEGEKVFLLDYETAPKPPFMQMIYSTTGGRILTFLNPHKNSIYFYDYDREIQIGETVYEKEGPNGILRPTGYYVKNMDSIYVYDMQKTELALTDSAGKVKQRISLRGGRGKDWSLYVPHYFLNSVIPFIQIQDQLLLTGFSPISLASNMIDKFRVSACIDTKTSEVEFMYTYPEELFGFDSNWEGGMALLVYPEVSPTGEIIHSYAVSHDLYIAPWNSNTYKSVYAGSNTASTIHAIDWADLKTTPHEVIFEHHAREDMYTAIRHDPYRKVYYRILLQGIPNATSSTVKEKKPVAVVIMDEEFNYLGETVIGTWEKWIWTNSFVTSEGLMMEYFDPDLDSDLDSDEQYLVFKAFKVEEIPLIK